MILRDGDDHNAALVDALHLANEHKLTVRHHQLLAVRIIVEVVCQPFVELVVLDRGIDGQLVLQVDDELLERLDLSLRVLELLEHVNADKV